jgi:hypothetical protein
MLTVALGGDMTQQDIDATRSAIERLRGVEAVTANVADIGDRLAHQRLRQEVERAIRDALDGIETKTREERTDEESIIEPRDAGIAEGRMAGS